MRNLISNFFGKISGPYDYTSGSTDRSINIQNRIKYIPVICYEVIFYWKLLNKKNINNDIIINITNDTWFGKFLGPYQHLYLTKLRAAEFNKPVLRVSNNGISAIISENGKITNYTKLNKFQTIQQTIKIKSTKTFYKTHKLLNNYFFIIILILFIINFIRLNANRK